MTAEERREKIELIRRTHEIFCGMKKMNIKLRTGNPPGHTDGETFISIPVEDPEADLVHRHEWSHIFFKTNLHARAKFVEEYSKQIRMKFFGTFMGLTTELDDFLHAFVNAMDDLRVCSLWARIYRRSALEIENRWRRIIVNSRRYQNDIILYSMAIGLGLKKPELLNSRWDKYQDVMERETQNVRGKGFSSCLIVVRRILDQIIDDVLKDIVPPPQEQLPATQLGQLSPPSQPALGSKKGLKRPKLSPKEQEVLDRQAGLSAAAFKSMVMTHRESENQDDGVASLRDTSLVSNIDDNQYETAVNVSVVLGQNADRLNQLLQGEQKDVEVELSRILDQENRPLENEALKAGMPDVEIHVAHKKDLIQTTLNANDHRLIASLKTLFMQIMNRRRRRRVEGGGELDVQAYLDLLNGSGDADVFLEDSSSKGFSAILLLDMSGSMRSCWGQVEHAAKSLAISMRSPYSKLEVWGFSSKGFGRINMIRFESNDHGFSGPVVDQHAWGMTPLHAAVIIALRRLKRMPGSVKHLLVVTDGMPTHTAITNSKDLVTDIGKEVSEARRSRLNVAGLVIGDIVTDEAADRMFGHKRFWERINQADKTGVYLPVVAFVSRAFVSYLRGV